MICLKYGGSINSRKLLNNLVEEFTDIARISGWDYEYVSENFQTMTSGAKKNVPSKEEVFGSAGADSGEYITLSSSEVYLDGINLKLSGSSGPVRLTFDRHGKLATISFCTTDTMGFNSRLTVKKYEFLYHPYVKLYTFSAEKHKQVINILDYIKKRYIKNLEVIDTSFYWNNRDEEELKVRMWKASRNRNLTY